MEQEPKLDIRHYKPINGTEVIPFAHAAVAALHEAECLEPHVLISWDQQAFAVWQDDKMVAVLLFEKLDWKRSINVALGYVHPDYRGQDLYRALWDRLVEHAQEEGLLRITGTTHANNKPMQHKMLEFGRKLTWLTYSFDVPTSPQPTNN